MEHAQGQGNKVKPQLIGIPPEILSMIVREVDLCTAVCFGLAHRTTYNALKLVHPGPIELATLRLNTPGPSAFHFPALQATWNFKCRCGTRIPVSSTLAGILLLPDTFKYTDFSVNYRLMRNRGDCLWLFLKNHIYDTMEMCIYDRYRIYGHFKLFTSYVIPTSTIRPTLSGDVRHQPSLIPSPFGKTYEAWKEGIVEAIINDMKHWHSREGWWGFWMEHTRIFEENHQDNFFSENEKVLIEAADAHSWPEIDKNSKQARITAYMMQRHKQLYPK